ncbi:glycosyl transferase family protein [Lichtheimia hyalospora FSU 10163]|nr:glycosyl transferase family protein [Lichtheimia hyalospora FSU 10163]
MVLTSTNKYMHGVITVAQSLRRLGSQYPLVVLHTPNVSEAGLKLLLSYGCHLKLIHPIHPPGETNYQFPRFAETWTKMIVWDQAEYDHVVLMDADMLPLQNMDELMDLHLPNSDYIAACHACTCNPQNTSTYPPEWNPTNCAYNNPTGGKVNYFNSGLIVLRPSHAKFQAIMDKMYGTSNLTSYTFSDQDFLNEVFNNKWVKLPYIYNALKTLPVTHPQMWHLEHNHSVVYSLLATD